MPGTTSLDNRAVGWLVEHFRGYRRRNPWDFCWRIALEGLAVSILPTSLLWCFGLADRKMNVTQGTLIGFAVVVAPIFETVLFQALPIGVARLLKAGFASQVFWSVAVFFVAHALDSGIATGLVAGLVGGFYLAFTYAHWRGRSRWTAFWTTAITHAMSNAVVVCLVIKFKEV